MEGVHIETTNLCAFIASGKPWKQCNEDYKTWTQKKMRELKHEDNDI